MELIDIGTFIVAGIIFWWFITVFRLQNKARAERHRRIQEEKQLREAERQMRLEKRRERLAKHEAQKAKQSRYKDAYIRPQVHEASTEEECTVCHGQDLYVNGSIMMCPKCKRNKHKVKNL